tara:strand:- start:76 stop:231 length:156 start_codon:yes stop_codon:yes gene_type:complete
MKNTNGEPTATDVIDVKNDMFMIMKLRYGRAVDFKLGAAATTVSNNNQFVN